VNPLREEIPFSEKILQTMHNLCATAPELARKSEELAQMLQMAVDEIEKTLEKFKLDGFVESHWDAENKKYYLTGRGIIKVCSIFT
jgi:hypothetical protein